MVVNFLFTSIAAAAFNCINVCLSLQICGTFSVTFIFYDVQRSSPFKNGVKETAMFDVYRADALHVVYRMYKSF